MSQHLVKFSSDSARARNPLVPRGLEFIIAFGTASDYEFNFPFKESGSLATYLKRVKHERSHVQYGMAIGLGLCSNNYGLSDNEKKGDMKLLLSHEISRIFTYFVLTSTMERALNRQIIYEGLSSSNHFMQTFDACKTVRTADSSNVRHYAEQMNQTSENLLIELYDYIIFGTFGISLPFQDVKVSGLGGIVKNDITELLQKQK